MKFTHYFQVMRQRPDRAIIRLDWILRVMEHPVRQVIQEDGRIRRWAPIGEMDGMTANPCHNIFGAMAALAHTPMSVR